MIVWHLLNDPAARYRDLGSDWHAATPTATARPATPSGNSKSLGFDVVITLREDAA